MNDEDKTAEQLAAEINGPQGDQVDVDHIASDSPSGAQETRDELILGKFKTVDDLANGYKELERTFTASRQANRVPAQQPAAPAESLFDEPTVAGIRALARREAMDAAEAERATRFAAKYKDDLADPLLRGAVLVEIQDANARGETIDQEVALANAKRALEARIAPKIEAAAKESFDEGKNIARRKEQAGAVGGVNGKAPEVDPDSLNAEEYAAYYGLERSF